MKDYIKKHWGKLLIAAIGLIPFGAAVLYFIYFALTTYPVVVAGMLIWACCLITFNNMAEGRFRK